jgi:hypothetical protein
MSLEARLMRVEALCGVAACPTCAVVPAIIFSEDGAPTTCPQCGRQAQEFTIDLRDREAPL